MPLPIVVATRQLPPKAWNKLTAQAQVVCWESDCPVTREWLLEHIPGANGLYCLLTDRIDQDVIQFEIAVNNSKVVKNTEAVCNGDHDQNAVLQIELPDRRRPQGRDIHFLGHLVIFGTPAKKIQGMDQVPATNPARIDRRDQGTLPLFEFFTFELLLCFGSLTSRRSR